MSYPPPPPPGGPFGDQPGDQPGAGYPPPGGPQPYDYGNSPSAGGGYGGYAQHQRTSKKAIWSLVSGLVGFVFCGVLLGPVAIVLGMSAKSDINTSGGRVSGSGLATAGIVLGTIATLLFLLGVLLLATGVIDLNAFDTTTAP